MIVLKIILVLILVTTIILDVTKKKYITSLLIYLYITDREVYNVAKLIATGKYEIGWSIKEDCDIAFVPKGVKPDTVTICMLQVKDQIVLEVQYNGERIYSKNIIWLIKQAFADKFFCEYFWIVLEHTYNNADIDAIKKAYGDKANSL